MTRTQAQALLLIGSAEYRLPPCPHCGLETEWDEGPTCRDCGLYWAPDGDDPHYVEDDAVPCDVPAPDQEYVPEGYRRGECLLPAGHVTTYHFHQFERITP